MKIKAISLLLCAFVFSDFSFAAETNQKLKVLVVTGGHGFEREPFFKMFSDNSQISFVEGKHNQNADAYEREDLLSFDVVVLYDMPKTITDEQKKKFLSLLDQGIGMVVLHHALVSCQHWPEYEQIIGGRYPEEDGKGGVVTKEVGYEHDVKVPVVIVAKDHPVTAGLKDFTLHDEIYWGFRVRPDVTPLITTTHEKSGKPLGWYRTQGKSRLVYLQSGHGPEAFEDANYQKLVAQSIRWVSKKEGKGKSVSLFNGKTLDGWVQRGGKAEYKVEEIQIVGRSVPNTPNSFLCTSRDYTNFVLELDFKVDQGLNSGVQIRSHYLDKPRQFEWKGKPVKIAAHRVHGLQVEIDPSTRAWTGGVHEEGGRAWLNNLKENVAAQKAFKGGEWNHFRIEAQDGTVRTWLNGVAASDLKDSIDTSGFIALQVHGVGKNEKPMEVRFRNLKIQEL